MISATELPSTRPYLIRALYDWCSENGFTPYVAVKVDTSVQVPREYVQNGEIVLNVSMDATSSLKLGNEFIEFKARFGGKPRDIMVPIHRVMAIYARENGQGMAFPVNDGGQSTIKSSPMAVASPILSAVQMFDVGSDQGSEGAVDVDEPNPPPTSPSRPALKRIK